MGRCQKGQRALRAGPFLFLSVSLLCAWRVFPQQPETDSKTPGTAARALTLHSPVDGTLTAGEQHLYRVALSPGEFAKLTLEQRGIDLVAEVLGPDQELLAKFNDQVKPTGEQGIVLLTDVAGSYTVRIKANLKFTAPGSYSIHLDEVRPATDDDRALFEARKLHTQAQAMNTVGNYDEALAAAQRALALAEQTPSAAPDYQARVMRDLGLIYWAKQNPKAKAMFERSAAIFEKSLGSDDPDTAYTQALLGNIYRVDGDYDPAEQILRRSLSVEEKTIGPDHPWIANTLRHLALLYESRRDFGKTEEIDTRALEMAQRTEGTDSLLYSQIENNLGVLFLDQLQYTEASPHLERSLAIQEKLFGPDYPPLAILLQNLGMVAREAKDYPLARQYYDRALAIRIKLNGPESRDVAANLINIANLHHSQGDYAKCLEIHLRVLNILEKTASPSEMVTIIALGNTANTYAAMGDVPNAVLYQGKTDNAIEQAIAANVAIGSERQKLLFISGEMSDRTDRTVSLSLHLAAKDPKASSLAALVLLQRKGRVLDAMTDSLSQLRTHSDARDQALLDQWKETTAQLAQLVLHGPGKTPPEEYNQRLRELADRKEDLEGEISRHSLPFRVHSAPVTLEAVQAAIPENAALLEFTEYKPFDPKATSVKTRYGPPHYAVYVIRRNGAPEGVDLGDSKAIHDAVENFRATVRDPLNSDAQEYARKLYALIMRPAREFWGGVAQLFISPDGDLNLIPFQALEDDEGHYLLQGYSIGYLTTGRDLLRFQIASRSKQAPVVLADPKFGEPQSREIAKAGTAASLSLSKKRRSITAAKDLSGVYFAPLSGTAQEARAIQNLFPDAHVLTGSEAAKEALKRVDAPLLLHIATHGFFLQEATDSTAEKAAKKTAQTAADTRSFENPLLRSGLALAGANVNKTGSDNGILTALEAANLNLWGTKLVTLSACDTGVGEVRNGEGVYGLRRAFFLAGTESLVMSLWPVSDYVTRQLMTQYYTGLKNGLGRAEALRRAQLAMLNRKERQHPFYWASFIEAGEWANLDGKP